MKNLLHTSIRSFVICILLLVVGQSAYANHLVGADLNYKWDSGNTYTITLVLYGDCGSAIGGSTSFGTLPCTVPKICIYNGNTYESSINLIIQAPTAGVEITPVCPDSLGHTQCSDISSTTPGIKKYVYIGSYTVPAASHYWRFLYLGYNSSTTPFTCDGGAAAIAGRATTITNISSAPDTYIQLIDTLDNTFNDLHNTSPILTVVPTPFFCVAGADNYNPGAVDPDADSLSFTLVPGQSGTGSTSCTAGGFVSYISPYTAAAPLATTAGSFSFNSATGQITFTPSVIQRSLVVYNIREFRNDTLIGTSMREMTFKVISCTNTAPTATIDSSTVGGTVDDGTHFHICANSGPFSITLNAHEPDTSNEITITPTGLPAGATFAVINNGSNAPQAIVSWTSDGVAFGNYTFYLTYTDNNCPLSGQQTLAYTIGIYPTPTLTYAITAPASCFDSAHVFFTPGGLGQPWTIALGSDTLNSDVLTSYTDTLAPGTYDLTIYTSISAQCSGKDTVVIPPPQLLSPTAQFTNPTYCGNNDGTITLSGLNAGALDSVQFTLNGVAQPVQLLTVQPDSTIHMVGLCAGTYNDIVISYGHCVSPAVGPVVLANPNYAAITLTATNASACGYKDGKITLHGLQQGQTVTANYELNGVAQPSFTNFVSTDGLLILSNLGAGIYSTIIVTTGGVCSSLNPNGCTSNTLGPVAITSPTITPSFTDVINYGCNGDTIAFTNLSTAPGSTVIYYTWHFGDGTPTDTVSNPSHLYQATNTTYADTLIMNNTGCIDTFIAPVSLTNFITASFTSSPAAFICQDSAITFTNNSVGTIPNYTWYFGDGTTSTDANPTHTYANSGDYQVMLVAANFVPCYDTATEVFAVDSNTVLILNTTDTALCVGQAVTLTGHYSQLGLNEVIWTFGDGSSLENVNPAMHAYDSANLFTYSIQLMYRACPNKSASGTLLVAPTPTLNLGPDTSICPGSAIIVLKDLHNAVDGGATWLWNTGATTPTLTINTPGAYYSTVTIGGCSASDTVLVANDCYMDIPNVFTPNGDGTNDYFYPREYLTKGLTGFKLDIYNRWGQNVFETSSLDGRGWDGKLNNTPQPEGVYIYVIDATFKDGQKEHRQGNVTLLR